VEVVVEVNASLGVDNGGTRVVDKVLGNDRKVGVSQDSLHITFGGFLEGSLDFLSSAGLFGADRQIHKGDIWGWDLRKSGECSEHTLLQDMLQTKRKLTRTAIPVSFPLRAGITFPTALAAPVLAGMRLLRADLPARQSLPPLAGPSTTNWLAVPA